jgi:hypothetical protein
MEFFFIKLKKDWSRSPDIWKCNRGEKLFLHQYSKYLIRGEDDIAFPFCSVWNDFFLIHPW